MIQLSFSHLIFIYLILSLGLVYLAWLWNTITTKRNRKKTQPHRFRCNACSFEFRDDSQAPLPQCPRCGSLNEQAPN